MVQGGPVVEAPSERARSLEMVSATSTDIDAFVAAWCTVSGYEVVADLPTCPELGKLWGVDAEAHPRSVVLRSPGTERGVLRLVETEEPAPGSGPARRVGPFGMEFFSAEAPEVWERMVAEGSFRPYTEPVDYDMSSIGSGKATSFAALGPSGVWVLITTMRWVPPPRPLPVVDQLVGPVINLPVATPPSPRPEAFYVEGLGMEVRFSGELADPTVNRIIGLEPDRRFFAKVFSLGDGQMAEHHFHDASRLEADPRRPGRLRAGPAVLTLAANGIGMVAERLAGLGFSVRGPLAVPDPPYRGRAVVVADGPSGETVELVEAAGVDERGGWS
jgi:hypothetical protein